MRRRRSLALLGLGSGPALAASLAGCRREPADRRLRVALGGLAPGERRVLVHREQVLEVLRTADGAVARSLLCPHYGCRVAWNAARGQYHCACHEGWFDAEGRPVSGPPQRPLLAVPVTIEGDTALVGEP